MEARTPEVRSVTPQRSCLPFKKLVCNQRPPVFVVPGFGSWCTAFCLTAHLKFYSVVQSPAIGLLLFIYMVTAGEFSANAMSMHVKNIQERKLYTGEDKAIAMWCTEIKCPKSRALRSLQTVMLCRGSRTTVEGCFLHQNHIRAASFMSILGWCLVEMAWFYGTLGKEQWKPWIFSLMFLFTFDTKKLLLSPGTLSQELQLDLHNCPELVLLSNVSGGFPKWKWERRMWYFFNFCVQPTSRTRWSGLDFKVAKIFKFHKKGKNSKNHFW